LQKVLPGRVQHRTRIDRRRRAAGDLTSLATWHRRRLK